MEDLDVFTALQLKELKQKNLYKHSEGIVKVTREINEMVKVSYEEGFLMGYEVGKNDESFNVKGKIISNLIKNTDMTDDEIFNIVDLGEDKWREHIEYLREEYEKGKKRGNELISKQDLKGKAKEN